MTIRLRLYRQQVERLLALPILFLAACGGETTAPPVPALLALGTAHAEIEQWIEAEEAFQRALELDPAEPVTAYNLAVIDFRTGDRAAARAWLDRARSGAPTELTARIELLRGKLAYEDGDEGEEIEAHQAALQADPNEASYAHALAELYLRLGQPEERGVFLQQAHGLWPDNAYLATELALWFLDQTDEALRQQGLALLDSLAGSGADDQITAYLNKGRQELAEAAGVPGPLRIVVNLLRGTQRFQHQAAELQERLEPAAIAIPVGTGSAAAAFPIQPPAVGFASSDLISPPADASGDEIRTVLVVDDSTPRPARARREAGLALLSDRALYTLGPGDKAFEPLADALSSPRKLLAGDIDDDERMELLLLAAGGLRLWDRPTDGEPWAEVSLEPALANLDDPRQGLLTDFEHDGDLDLLIIQGDGRLVLSTHRGEAGFGPPQKAPLPVDERIRRLAAADLDADADQDLLLVTSTELIILRNWRQGNYAPQARLPLPRGEKPTQILPLDYDSDGHMDVVILLERGFDFWRGDGRASLAHDDAARGDTIFFNEMLRPAQLTAADLDLDGDQDLLATGRATTLQGAGLIGLFNDGNGRFAARTDLLEEPWPAARGSLVLDLDGDRDPDILSWGEAGLLRSFRGHGAENQNWLALRLRAPPNKVPRDARGVRLQVVAGTTTQWLEPRRPNLILGLGRDQPSLIKATWPNGISEYLFEPEAEAEHTLELSMRVEGSCPFLYASDGEDLRFVTDILGLSPVGMLAAPGHYVAADPEEYLRLPDWVAPIEATEEGAGSTLELAITEELREALYLDQAELVAVDAPSDVAVYNGEQWLPQAVQGLALHLLTPLEPPASVLDDRGHEVLDVVRQRDERFLTNHRGDNRYQGAVQPHQLTLELPAHIAAAENPVLVLVGWLHWGNTSTNVARSQDPDGAPMFPRLEVPDGAGGWRRVPARMGLPAGKTKPVVVDLTDTLDPADPRLRVTTDFEVYWDLIAAANRLPDDATPHRIHRLAPQSADLRWRGFSRWYRNADNGPYLFDYLDHRSYPWRLDSAGREIVLSWQELEGHYTAFGPVTDLLQQADDRLAVVGSGEEIRLRFDVANLPPLPDGWRRTFFLHSEGWEKDGDPNVACSRTVEPLPYRGMRHDPCSGQLRELRPQVEDASRSRWVARERLDRRVVAHGEAGGV